MATMYELTRQFEELLEMIDDPNIPDDVLQDTMEGLEGEIELKADGCAKVIAEATGRAEMLTAEIERLTARKAALLNGAKRIKGTITDMMIHCGKPEFKTDLFSFKIQKNPPKVVIDGNVPDKYLVPQEPKVDLKSIKADIDSGAKIDFAHLEQTEGVRIR